MNEPAIRAEEQIISLFPDRETLICRGTLHERESAGPICTAVIRKIRRRNPPKKRRIERWIYRMKNVSW